MTDGLPRKPKPNNFNEMVAELVAQQQAQAEEKETKARIEILTKSFDRATTYANAILVIGYAGAFTIWSFTKAQLPDKAMIVIALALLISLAAFVSFEVIKMIVMNRAVLAPLKVLKGVGSPLEKSNAIKQVESVSATVAYAFNLYWIFTMIIAVGGAIIAFLLLAYNFVAVLMQWNGWPA